MNDQSPSRANVHAYAHVSLVSDAGPCKVWTSLKGNAYRIGKVVFVVGECSDIAQSAGKGFNCHGDLFIERVVIELNDSRRFRKPVFYSQACDSGGIALVRCKVVVGGRTWIALAVTINSFYFSWGLFQVYIAARKIEIDVG